MSNLFSNHSFLSLTLKHKILPIYKTDEFDFFRCVAIDEWVYDLNISSLHAGNLRDNDNGGRYSKLFPNEKISYWADSKSTALAEIKKHGGNKNYLTFHSYDDASSSFPTMNINEPLTIIDGRDIAFHEILLKVENSANLSIKEQEIIQLITEEGPDCLAYCSVAKTNGVNFLFFEKGFQKLALRKVQLYLGERSSKNKSTVMCAVTSDYMPIIENYGKYFKPIAKVAEDKTYKNTNEYKTRKLNYGKFMENR
ncbi:hypothetical protein ACYSNU_07105 [Enterococcus sp. LJL120]